MKQLDVHPTLSRRSLLKGAAALSLVLPAGAFLAGCDGGAGAASNDAASADAPADDAGSDAPAAPDLGRVLVAYYSAQGHTEAVAQVAADALGADLFTITPVTPYSDDDLNYSDSESRVSREHEDESLRAVDLSEVTPADWETYDTVLVGYPIWWGIAAWPTDGFVSGNDFSGKTVIPFCTSASSGLGQSGENLAGLAGTGDWQEGMRFRSSVPEEDVIAWVEGL